MLNHFPDDITERILKCSECGFCQAVCPVFAATLRPAYNTRGKMMVLKEFMDGQLELSENIGETFYACTACQACVEGCPSNVRPYEIVQAARRVLFEKGLEPNHLLVISENILRNENVYGLSPEERIDIYPPVLREKARKGLLSKRAETLLFMGCLPSYMDMKIVPSLLKLMDAAQVEYTTLSTQEGCCGFPLYLMGSPEFAAHAERMVETLLKTGVRELITPCAGCYKTFKTLYPGLQDVGIRVLHAVQFIEKLIRDEKLRFTETIEKRCTYHDPCDLARGCNIFEEPRNILHSIPGLICVEMKKNRLDARCCGGGGGMQAYKPDLAAKMAAQRIQDAFAVEAEVLVSACPACKDNLRKGLKHIPKAQRQKLKIMDLVEVVSAAL